MRILIVNDSRQPPVALQSTASDVAFQDTMTSTAILAALSLPDIDISKLTRLSADVSGDSTDCQPTQTDPLATFPLKDSPELASKVLDAIGLAYLASGHLVEAEHFVTEALDLRLKFFGAGHPEVASSLNSLARVLRDGGRLDEAVKKVREAMDINSKVVGADSLPVAADIAVLSSIQFQRSKLADAQQSIDAALKIFEDRLQSADPWVAYLLDLHARIYQCRSNYRPAAELYEKILALDVKQYGSTEHPVYATHLHNLGTVLEAMGDLSAAECKYDEAIRIHTQHSGAAHPNLIDAYANRGGLRRVQGGNAEGARLDMTRALELNQRVRGNDHAFVGYDLANLGHLEFDLGNVGEALEYFDQALEIFRTQLPATHTYIASALTMKGRTLIQAKQPHDAEEPLNEAISAWTTEYGDRSQEYAIARATLARAWYMQTKRLEEAEQYLRTALPIVVAVRGAEDKTAQLICSWLNELNASIGKPEIPCEQLAKSGL